MWTLNAAPKANTKPPLFQVQGLSILRVQSFFVSSFKFFDNNFDTGVFRVHSEVVGKVFNVFPETFPWPTFKTRRPWDMPEFMTEFWKCVRSG